MEDWVGFVWGRDMVAFDFGVFVCRCNYMFGGSEKDSGSKGR